jgi:hypothetical protein
MDINDQLRIVKKWWNQLILKDVERRQAISKHGEAMIRPKLNVDSIAKMFVEMKIF